jgi:hypothetical protein
MHTAPEAERGAAHPLEDYEKNIAALAERILSTVSATAKGMGVACVTLHTKDQHPAEGIIQTAKARGCDLIVMTSQGRRGLQKALLGSQANKVLSYSSSGTDLPIRGRVLFDADRCLGGGRLIAVKLSFGRHTARGQGTYSAACS